MQGSYISPVTFFCVKDPHMMSTLLTNFRLAFPYCVQLAKLEWSFIVIFLTNYSPMGRILLVKTW